MEREDNFKKEIENPQPPQNFVSLLDRNGDPLNLDRLQLAEQLGMIQRKCEELEDMVAWLNKEKRVLTDRVELAEEKSDRIFRANLKMTNERNNSISELEKRIMESERLTEFFQEKCTCLDTKMAKMDQELEDLKQRKSESDQVVEELKLELEREKMETDKKAELLESMLENRLNDNNSPEACIREGDIAHTVKKSPCSQTAHNPPQPAHKAAGDIIEILDSDDEEKPTVAAESSKRVPSSDEIDDLVQRRKRNRTESMENLFTFSTTKMKKEVHTVDEDVVLIQEKGNKDLKSSHDNVDCSPSGRCVEEVHESQNHMNDRVSADSEDESLSDSRMEDFIANLRSMGAGDCRNSPQPWTREDDISHTDKNLPGSQSGHNPPPPGSNECMEPLGSCIQIKGQKESGSGRRLKRARQQSRYSSSSSDVGSSADEARMRSANDHRRLGGLAEEQATENYQEDYRLVQSSEIFDDLPECRYGPVVKKGKITTRGGYSLVPQIAASLLAHFPECVKDYPQLGNFLLLDGKGNVPNAAIHQLFARVCNWPKDEDCCRLFVVNNMVARLSPVEFSMITGLQFLDDRTDDDVDKPEDLKERAFPEYHESEKLVPVEEVLIKVEEYLSGTHGAPETQPIVINLTFVWLITKVLVQPKRKELVPDEIFALCSDLDACERYSWGKKVWKAVVDDCLAAIGDINGDGKRNWNAYGFINIIAYWMIEAFEGAAVQLGATPRRQYFHSYPRMLRWSLSNSAPKNEDFKAFLVNQVKVVYPRLKPDIVELQSRYFYDSLMWYEQRFAGETDCLRFSPDYTFCTDYVKFLSGPVLSEDDHIDAEEDGTTGAPPQTSAPAQMFDHADPSSFQAGPSGGPPSWWADFLQTNMDREDRDRQREERYRLRDEKMFAEMSSRRDLLSQFGMQMDEFGFQLNEFGRRIDSLEEEFERRS